MEIWSKIIRNNARKLSVVKREVTGGGEGVEGRRKETGRREESEREKVA